MSCSSQAFAGHHQGDSRQKQQCCGIRCRCLLLVLVLHGAAEGFREHVQFGFFTGEMRSSLVSSTNDILRLVRASFFRCACADPDVQVQAKEVATIREAGLSNYCFMHVLAPTSAQEHDQAIGDLGSLTERVAKSAIAGIQRSEDCYGAVFSTISR